MLHHGYYRIIAKVKWGYCHTPHRMGYMLPGISLVVSFATSVALVEVWFY